MLRGGGGSREQQLRVNGGIRSSSVRLIDADGTQLGIKSLAESLAAARGRGLDLVEIVPQANPPVCKLLDFSKFRYEQEKKVRGSRKKQKSGLLKEVRLRPHIGTHDLEFKIKHIEEFIKEHDKVRITVVFRGREMQHQDIGLKLLHSIRDRLAAVAMPEQEPLPDRNRLLMTLIPRH